MNKLRGQQSWDIYQPGGWQIDLALPPAKQPSSCTRRVARLIARLSRASCHTQQQSFATRGHLRLVLIWHIDIRRRKATCRRLRFKAHSNTFLFGKLAFLMPQNSRQAGKAVLERERSSKSSCPNLLPGISMDQPLTNQAHVLDACWYAA